MEHDYVYLENLASPHDKWNIYHCSKEKLLASLREELADPDLPFSNAEIMILYRLNDFANNEQIPFMPERFNAVLTSLKILRGDALIGPDNLHLIPNQETTITA